MLFCPVVHEINKKYVWCLRNKLDQNAIANARLNNLEHDLKLKGSEYNTCISILYVG